MTRPSEPDISAQVARAATAIQAADAIAIVGAGMSRDIGFPMSTELNPFSGRRSIRTSMGGGSSPLVSDPRTNQQST
jgi:DNA-binding MurR/RpiR family transcriptional regulator